MTQPGLTTTERELVRAAVVRLRARVAAVVFGLTGGVGLMLATLWLVVRGGSRVGPHLGLLGNYFPGYEVTWTGALIGLFYGALVGAATGWSIATIYNRLVDRRA